MAEFILWGLTASPYQLKMQAQLDYAEHPWQRWPEQAGRLQALGMAMRLQRAQRCGAVQRYPQMSPGLDEYPSVPYYTLDKRHFYYDSSGLARHLDEHPQRHQRPLLPDDPALHFACRLIDEALDEFGLYMVHHQRWVTSAQTTPMGDMTAREFAPLLPSVLLPTVARRLYRRQSRRCPYLFSVAPAGFDAGVAAERTPPSRRGFPPTHALLDEAWRGYLSALESLLSQQPYLLGERFTLADASTYGQLGMNLVDGATTERLQELAPHTYRWLCDIDNGRHRGSEGPLRLSAALQPLLAMIGDTFIPLMQQNETAFEQAARDGQTRFNEAAFDAGQALHDGELLGHPYRAVIKTFQVAVWRELRSDWQALASKEQAQLAALLPVLNRAF